MVKVSYQVIWKNDFREEDFRRVLKSILEETYNEEYDEFTEDVLDGVIEIKYYHQITQNKHIIGFDIDFSIFIPNPENRYTKKIIENFNKNLISYGGNIETAFKFYDENLLNRLEGLYEEIFKIEMKLREVLTFIFIDNYKDDGYYNLLRDYKIDSLNNTLYKKSGNLKKNIRQREAYLKKKLENKFFYLLFSDYMKFEKENLKGLDKKDLIKHIQSAEDFNEFKEIISNRGIQKYEYFLLSIKEDLSNLEDIRNCVAHNRTPSKEELDNYEKAVKDINNKIEIFLRKEIIKPKVVFATIYVEELPNTLGIYRQNSTTLELTVFGREEMEEIDTGDEWVHGDSIYEIEDDFKELLLKYLEENGYDTELLDKSLIEIERI